MRLGSNFRLPLTTVSGLAAIVFMTAIALATTPTPSPVPEAAPPPKATPGAGDAADVNGADPSPTPLAIKEPKPIKNKKYEFSTRTEVGSCRGMAKNSCTIDTFLVAKAVDNGDLAWERRLFFRKYEFSEGTPPPVIYVKSLKFAGTKMVHVMNDRGDEYEVEADRGHMKKPKKPREYSR